MIENEHFTIALQANGTLQITDKRSGQVYADQMVFEDNGDDGDSYNYSPPERDLIVSSAGSQMSATTTQTSVSQTLSLRFTLDVPYDLEERAAGITSGSIANAGADISSQRREADPLPGSGAE
ncbi:glycoside hydrolase family 38 C-terminal domain-containing protein [Paenibacillus amylolyticus]|nr:glycoside hydrolase family 38 C-terminal domain-containing protein [Paenibacillus amylolyticus]